MPGIERKRSLKEAGAKPPSYRHVRRIRVHYSDSRTVSFRPEGGKQFFNQDDLKQLVRVLDRASSTAEWAEVSGQHAE